MPPSNDPPEQPRFALRPTDSGGTVCPGLIELHLPLDGLTATRDSDFPAALAAEVNLPDTHSAQLSRLLA